MADQSKAGINILISGVVLGAAAIGFGVWMSLAKVDRPLTEVSGGKKLNTAALTQEARDAQEMLAGNHNVLDCAPKGLEVNGKPRFAPIFFSPELWQISFDSKQKNVVIDIYDPTSPYVHGEVPNAWFLRYGLNEALGRADGLELDSDGDGFSNLEEFNAKTDPADASSLPPLIQVGKTPKLVVSKVEKASAVVTVDSNLTMEEHPESANVKIFQRVGDQKPIHKKTVKVGESFGLSEKGEQTRFTVLGFEKSSYTDRFGNSLQEMAMRVRDNEALSGDREFLLRAGRPRLKDPDEGTPNAKGRIINDTTVTLRVTAGPAAGKKEGSIRVPLHGTFTVPGTSISCQLESVDEAGSVNVLPKGAESPVNVPKEQK